MTTPNPHLRPVGDDGRPRVRVGAAPEMIRLLTTALDDRIIPDTYVADGAPVVVEAVSGAIDPTSADEDVSLPLAATPLRSASLAGLLAEHVDVVQNREVQKGEWAEVEISPPGPVLAAVLARRSWPGLPVLRRIISTPILRPDGTLLQTPGYDESTGFLLANKVHLDPVPEHPTTEQVRESREFLLDRFLRDFPWRSTADRANYLALLVTPIIRPYTRALSPFGVIEATMPGSGKTILTGCVGMLVGQRVLTWTDSDDAELRKSITTVLADQVGVVVFDNLTEGTVIESAVLARLMTERTWTDRRLGSNTAATFPNDRLWLATGNNLRTGGDMASRAVWVRLDPDCPRPEARTGFTIPNLDSWILDPANQSEVLRHVLTLILDWTSAGAPIARGVPQMRQFTRWAQHVGGFLEHHRVPGFLGNAETSRELDETAQEWRSFLLYWHDLYGGRQVTANEVRSSAEPILGPDPWAGTFPTTQGGKLVNVKSLGWRLKGQTDRWREDIVLRSVPDPSGHGRRYWVQREADRSNSPEETAETAKPHDQADDQW
jgi:hypothetical protein